MFIGHQEGRVEINPRIKKVHFAQKRRKELYKRSFGEVMGERMLFPHRRNKVGDDLTSRQTIT